MEKSFAMKNATSCLMLLTLASCGSNKQGLYPVLGRVSWQGTPAAGATVFFHRQGTNSIKDHVTMGIVRDDGTFQLVCGSLGTGAIPGEYDVTIEWKQVLDRNKGGPRRSSDRLNGRYADPSHSKFHVTVHPRRNELAPFVLTD